MNIFIRLFTILLITSCGTKNMENPSPKKCKPKNNKMAIPNERWIVFGSDCNRLIMLLL